MWLVEIMVKHIVIVGGGAAGWLTAGILAAEFHQSNERSVAVTLVESPDVNTIGVGEGTWPTMRTTLKKIGISEAEFIKECSASFKQGSKFVGWKTGAVDDVYYHPFTLPKSESGVNISAAWLDSYSNFAYGDAVCIQGRVCEKNLAPKQITTPEYAGALNYGYHLDAGKFGVMLQSHCVAKLGVEHIVDHVGLVESGDDGSIAAVVTKKNGRIVGDLFVDCTGSRSVLLGKYLQVPFVDLRGESINDFATAIQVPYLSDDAEIASATVATAQSSGWTWDIGLSSRRGVGYVYSSSHISCDQAEVELRNYIAKSVGSSVAGELSSKTIPIAAGHREIFWKKNCVAVGMAAGFIEPLEASALALVELSANMIRDELPMSSAALEIVAERFNSIFRYRWQRISEFLKLHYVLSERRDTPYWRDVTDPERVPDSLKRLLELWKYRAPHYNDMLHVEEIFPAASYEYVLFGMGYHQSRIGRASDNVEAGKQLIAETLRSSERYIAAMPSNRDLLARISQFGLQKI